MGTMVWMENGRFKECTRDYQGGLENEEAEGGRRSRAERKELRFARSS
jgi:hypothetical protein